MGDYSGHVPFLSNDDNATDFEKKTKTPVFMSTAKWVLKGLMWLVFIAWVSLMFFYPLEFVNNLFFKFINATSGNLFGITGSIFLAFTAPVLIIAFLSVLYLIISNDEDEVQEKKASKPPRFRVWTFPVLVDGPFGVVSVAEFIGILLVGVFVVYGCAAYIIRNWHKISQYEASAFYKSVFMLERTGANLGLIGMFCLALLFLPISRGSMLLRLIDIPFEHATRYHVWLGHLTMALFTLHGLFYVIAWALERKLMEELLEWRDVGVANLAGVISLIAGLLMWVTSLPPVRKWNFELFFYTHQLYVVFVLFLAFHVGDFIFCFAAGGIFLFMLDRFLRFIQSRKTVDIISARSLPCGTLELVFSKPSSLRYNALSFIFLQIRELSWLQWHPFSVSSSPMEGNHHLSVLIKVLGEWTDKLKCKLSKNHREPEKLLQSQLQSLITASVEGPYGHESPYHLTYKHLVLVAGGIGISPFLAVLSDIIHRLKKGKPCMPKNIVIVWAIKKSDELPLLSMLNVESIDPVLLEALNLEIQIYVTRESEARLEEGKAFGPVTSCTYNPTVNRSTISSLVGTGDNIWAGIYVIASTIGFVIFLALLDVFYINPKGINIWWYKGFLLVLCMVAGVVIFGGAVVALWHLWERRMLASEKHYCNSNGNKVFDEAAPMHSSEFLLNLSTFRYGCRPDFKEIFETLSKRWGAVDVGVLVCGPPALQSSVAKEIRSHSLRMQHDSPVFHFNSHSFDL
uniref:Ferric-chelate reductase (NADH) n=1 Tax=Opuntia streptacantha TaxID=393608 RepID=A0A7C9EE32_OPUST